MKLDSKYFDSIRVAPQARARARLRARSDPRCQWKGCESARALIGPRGAAVGTANTILFCIDHVRQYNASYNYFDGMNDAEVQDFQKDALTGHRPTWKVGVNVDAKPAPDAGADAASPAGPVGDGGRWIRTFFARRAKAAREHRPRPVASSSRSRRRACRRSICREVRRASRSRLASRNW